MLPIWMTIGSLLRCVAGVMEIWMIIGAALVVCWRCVRNLNDYWSCVRNLDDHWRCVGNLADYYRCFGDVLEIWISVGLGAQTTPAKLSAKCPEGQPDPKTKKTDDQGQQRKYSVTNSRRTECCTLLQGQIFYYMTSSHV